MNEECPTEPKRFGAEVDCECTVPIVMFTELQNLKTWIQNLLSVINLEKQMVKVFLNAVKNAIF